MQLLGERTDDEAFRPQWLATGLRGMLRASRAKDVVLDIDFALAPNEVVRIHVEGGRLNAVVQPEGPPDVVVHGELSLLAELADGTVLVGDALADGRLSFEGADDDIRAFQRLFPQPVAP
jgi:hypothetical protein